MTAQRLIVRWSSIATVLLATAAGGQPCAAQSTLRVGFAHADITPEIHPDRPVWLAGYTPGRSASGVHDPLYVRTLVISDGLRQMALVSVDLIGLQLPAVDQVRKQLPDLDHLTVSSTHNHEGPDVIGIWGRTFVHRGVDDAYLDHVLQQIVNSVRAAQRQLEPAQALFGTARDDSLLDDRRLPVVKDGVLRSLQFQDPRTRKPLGIVIQWNCHPEALGAKNRQLTADFPAATIAALQQRHGCPVVYFSGSVGGLMAPPRQGIVDAENQPLAEGDFRYAQVYGQRIAALADQALQAAQPIELTPLQTRVSRIAIPVQNPWYRSARAVGVVRREGRVWTGDFRVPGPRISIWNAHLPTAVETELVYLRLGQLGVVGVPGEIYPELVYGQIPDPADPGADHPDAAREPSVQSLMPDDRWMLLGLANDEIGYIIPRRQWDIKTPYAYQRRQPQYGEINSCGPDVAPIVMQALAELVAE